MGLWLRRHAVVVAVPFIALIGWLDYLTGPEIGFSLLYLLPISVVAWRAGRQQALVCAASAAVCWQLADLGWRTSPLAVSLWNGFTRLIIYAATGWLVARVHVDRMHLVELNRELERALFRQTSLARTDAVTRLPNSRAFLEHLQSDLLRFAQQHCTGTLLFLDLDNFKSVNDQYGHAAGDTVLGRIADAIQQVTRGADIAARIGGDEFAVLVWHPDHHGAAQTRASIEAAIREIAADYPRAALGVSIGVAGIDNTTQDPEEIIRIADHAMYQIKAHRKAAHTGR